MLTPRYPNPADHGNPKSQADPATAKDLWNAYSAALTYLEKHSPAAKALIKALRENPTKIDVAICTFGSEARSETPFNSMFGFEDDGTATVQWNPGFMFQVKAKGKEGKAGKQSAALALAHELGHAKQWLDDKAGYLKEYKKALAEDRGALLRIENANVTMHEIPIAKELGEPWRPDYESYVGAQGFVGGDAAKPWPVKVTIFK